MAPDTEKTIARMSEDITEIKTALTGYNGYPGLCQRHEDLASDYYKFKRWVIAVAAFAVGAGILSAGAISLFGG